ncbi:MAG TPA: transglutaminase family protein [Burkholderiaceae bacterium]|nr:transglutaminase family protein [Burkholderiaceae bacterium]
MTDNSVLLISHVTEYQYSSRVELGHHVAHLTPRDDDHQSVERCELKIDPAPNELRSDTDAFGNVRSYFSIYAAHERLRVEALSRLRVRARGAGLDPQASPDWESVRDSLHYQAGRPYLPASEFVFASSYVPRDRELARYALASFAPGLPLTEAAIELMHRVHADFRYRPASTEIATPLLQAFRERTGVCQDFSHVMIGCLRSIGLSARYVSGYLAPASAPGQARPVGAEASHAWVSVFCPVLGWVDLDATNDVIPGRNHVTVAIGRDYGDVAPLRGVIRGGGEHELSVAVRVVRSAGADRAGQLRPA